MAETKPDRRRRLTISCGSLLVSTIICAACLAAGAIFRPENGEMVLAEIIPTRLSEFVGSEMPLTEAVGLVQTDSTPTPLFPPTTTPRPTATVTPTYPPLGVGSPTVPPTDTPRPTPTSTPTGTPIPPTATLDLARVGQFEGTDEAEPDLLATAIIEILTGREAIAGTIFLPEDTIEQGHTFVPGIAQVEFKWVWTGTGGCDPPPDGFGFELRVWPDRPDFGPLGVDDAAGFQEKISCDPQTGKRSVLLNYLSGTPAVQIQGAGSFLWDVALIQINPYTPIYSSAPRKFEISLNYPVPGPFDPNGKAGGVDCGKFGAWALAQAFYVAAGGPSEDRFTLDADRNGVACDDIAPCLVANSPAVCKARFAAN